jgi:hypothetical protein
LKPRCYAVKPAPAKRRRALPVMSSRRAKMTRRPCPNAILPPDVVAATHIFIDFFEPPIFSPSLYFDIFISPPLISAIFAFSYFSLLSFFIFSLITFIHFRLSFLSLIRFRHFHFFFQSFIDARHCFSFSSPFSILPDFQLRCSPPALRQLRFSLHFSSLRFLFIS